jgi:hypothetical protein
VGDLDTIEGVHLTEAIVSDKSAEFVICTGAVWISP